jgi:hypothetical protein
MPAVSAAFFSEEAIGSPTGLLACQGYFFVAAAGCEVVVDGLGAGFEMSIFGGASTLEDVSATSELAEAAG